MQIRTKATSSSNSMHIRLPVLRYIQIYHQVDLVCIYTSGGLTSGKTSSQKCLFVTTKCSQGKTISDGGHMAGDGLTRSVEISTLHWYCFSLDIASSLWS